MCPKSRNLLARLILRLTLATVLTEDKPAGQLVPGLSASKTTPGQSEDVSKKAAMPSLQDLELEKVIDSFVLHPDQVSTLLPMLDVQSQTWYSDEVKKLWAVVRQHPKKSEAWRKATFRINDLEAEILERISSSELKSGAAATPDTVTKPISQDDLSKSMQAPISSQVSQKPASPMETDVVHTSYLLTALEQKQSARRVSFP